MNDQTNNSQSRRQFLGRSAAVLAATSVIPFHFGCSGNTPAETVVADSSKPNSKFGGVQIGTITYSWRTMDGGLQNIIRYCKEANIGSIELMSTDLETYLGAPENPMQAMFARGASRDPANAPGPPSPRPPDAANAPGPPPSPRPPDAPNAPNAAANPNNSQYIPAGSGYVRVPRQLTPEQQAARDKYNEDLKNWRIQLSLSKVEEARKLLEDNGIHVHIVKFSPAQWSDEEIDYAFKVAKAMGAKAVTEEISLDAARKLAPFAEKHDMYVAFHNHMQYAEEGFSVNPILEVSPAVMLNFDAGHFYGSTGIHPNEILKKYHDRIYSIHIKDKTGPTAPEPNANQVWGQGETPLEELLLLIKQEKWPIYCDIELEYPVKSWSNPVKEVGICVNYARQILL
ncbi:MAG: sugar phosphate isomerase/epimerase [Tannerellaceae bacterium]|jgi:sugar phosphate isomerase/epimerase|nr:sugar phosphate isomerase/epimerase [Tannerellaceae bacterium]